MILRCNGVLAAPHKIILITTCSVLKVSGVWVLNLKFSELLAGFPGCAGQISHAFSGLVR
jgi:hypothetical protein